MEARVISTGKIVEVKRDLGYLDHEYKTEEGERFASEELDFSGEPDYWEKLKHQYAGMAMQGLVTRGEVLGSSVQEIARDIAEISCEVAHALVEKMKNQSV